MADTTVHVTELAKNTEATMPAGTDIVAANTHVITPTRACRKGLIVIQHTTAAAKTATIAAGDNPPSPLAGLGAETITLPDATAGTITVLVAIETARFMQGNGTIEVTVAAGTTGTIEFIELP